MEKLVVYNKIHRLLQKGFSNSAIARKLKISRNIVIAYGKMKPDKFHSFALLLQNRSKKLYPYREIIIEWLKKHPNLTGAQIYDWLNVDFVTEGTVRNYVNEICVTCYIQKSFLQEKIM